MLRCIILGRPCSQIINFPIYFTVLSEKTNKNLAIMNKRFGAYKVDVFI